MIAVWHKGKRKGKGEEGRQEGGAGEGKTTSETQELLEVSRESSVHARLIPLFIQ